MTANFQNNGTDLDDIFAPRLWFQGGGSLWAWGGGSSGRLGVGDFISRSSTVQVGSLTNWAAVSAGGEHTIARKSDGFLSR